MLDRHCIDEIANASCTRDIANTALGDHTGAPLTWPAEQHALRAIAPGEEITVNYGETHHEGKLRCQCGAPNCVDKL